MDFYELAAEGNEYFYFKRRKVELTHTHIHSAVEFLFVEKGEARVCVDGEERILTRGQACFSNSFTPHFYDDTPTADVYVFLGERSYFEEPFSTFGGKVPPTFFTFDNFELLDFLWELCNKDKQNGRARYETFAGCVRILLAEILESNHFLKRTENKQGVLVSSLLRFMQEHYKEAITLQSVAKTFGYSHEHISRILYRYTGEHWSDILNRIRVRKARTLLHEDPSLNVLDVALSCGFESTNTFYRAYRKEFGEQPRKNIKK